MSGVVGARTGIYLRMEFQRFVTDFFTPWLCPGSIIDPSPTWSTRHSSRCYTPPILCVTFRTEQAFFVTKTRCQVISMDRHHEFIPDDWPFHENANVRFLRVRHPRPTRVRVLHIARDEEVASSHTHPFIRTVGAVISSRKSEGR